MWYTLQQLHKTVSSDSRHSWHRSANDWVNSVQWPPCTHYG